MLEIILGTPIWVWGVFVYILFVGVRATRERVVFIPKFLVIPVILTGLKYQSIIISLNSFLIYLVCLGTGVLIGYSLTKTQNILPAAGKYSAKVPGSYLTLVVLLCFFSVKYIFGYLEATAPELALQYILYSAAAGGLLPGILLGRTICYAIKISK